MAHLMCFELEALLAILLAARTSSFCKLPAKLRGNAGNGSDCKSSIIPISVVSKPYKPELHSVPGAPYP